jgi:hypothetical protein
MPSSAYFLRQADICLRLSLIASEEQISTRLIAMALEYKARAAAVEVDIEPMAPEIADKDRTADHKRERDQLQPDLLSTRDPRRDGPKD